MESTIAFGDQNSGSQVGTNYGHIRNEFHAPPNLDDRFPVVEQAAFDSFDNQHGEQCLTGTRTELISQIDQWATSPQGRCIFWLNGMAGTGKSTISRTVARSFSKRELLGASFFFKRGEADRGNARRLFPTLAKQLASSIPELGSHLRQAVLDNPGITGKGIREQFDKILLQPALRLEESGLRIRTAIIVVDALDECDGDNDIRLILQLLPHFRRLKLLHLRVFLTSRPELPIRLGFSNIAIQEHQDFILHEIPEEVIKHDISLFLNQRLSIIRKERLLPVDWPGDRNLESLVTISVPLFIFAATICRLFEDPHWDPEDSLTEILSHQNDEFKLDGTYLPVLDHLLKQQRDKRKKEQLIKEFQQVIGAIIILESPLSTISLSRLLDVSENLVNIRLGSLHSILQIPDDRNLPVRLFHLSFRDFLIDTETRDKTPFAVDEKAAHSNLFLQCLRLMGQGLRKNICELPHGGLYRTEIDQRTIDRHISPEIQYSCRYWVHHLEQCTERNMMISEGYLFLQEHFLHWAETMSLLGVIPEAIRMINTLESTLQMNQDTTIPDFLHDAKRFILKNHRIISETPLQIYSAGLVFAPKTGIMFRVFQAELPPWICKLPQANNREDLEIQTLEGHSGAVRSVAFSPDGSILASGSSDGTVKLWDSVTGALQQTLEGNSEILSVAFSPDGFLLASGSRNGTVQLWNPATGVLQQTLENHFAEVTSVAFSSTGRLLASSSTNWVGDEGDDKIWLWDPVTGVLQQVIEGVSAGVTSLAFSPSGQLLASGSGRLDLDPLGMAVQLWDPATGTLKCEFRDDDLEDDPPDAASVAFSPDGRLLASGSHYGTVSLWDPASGVLQEALGESSGPIESVTFSPDGRLLASGSRMSSYEENNHVEIWNMATGELRQTFKSHFDDVNSVAFSPGSQLLASGSYDMTVRLWDPSSAQQTPQGHQEWTRLLVFSPNGCFLASGSNDNTICLWDPVTCTQKWILEGHSGAINTIVFSSDSLLMASTSDDKIIQLWDPNTGIRQHTLEGHPGMTEVMAFSSDSRLLASIASDMNVRIWDTATGELQREIESCACSDPLLAFTPGSESLVFSSSYQVVRLWNPFTSVIQQKKIPNGHMHCSRKVNSVAFSPDGHQLALARGKVLQLWDSAMDSLHRTFKIDWRSADSISFSPDSRLIVAAGERAIRIWDTATGTLQRIIHTQTDWSEYSTRSTMAFSTNGQLLASTEGQNIVEVWEPASGALRHTLMAHPTFVKSVVFSPDSCVLASASRDSTVRLWDMATGQLLNNLNGHTDEICSVAFSPNGQLLASASKDETIRLWDPNTGALQKVLTSNSKTVTSLEFSPDSQLLASGSGGWDDRNKEKGAIQLWNPDTGILQRTLESHSFPVESMAFSPSGCLLWVSYDVTVRFWDPATGRLQRSLSGFSTKIGSIAFTSDSRLLAIGLSNKTIELWDPAISTLQKTLNGHLARVTSVTFSPDGLLLASGSDDKTIRLWNPVTEELHRVISLNEIPKEISFSRDGSYLNTNAGAFQIQLNRNRSTTGSSQDILDIWIENEQWIMINNHRAVRIPVELRPVSSAAYGSVLALGHHFGQVSLMEFCI